jgi:hypothetical protein
MAVDINATHEVKPAADPLALIAESHAAILSELRDLHAKLDWFAGETVKLPVLWPPEPCPDAGDYVRAARIGALIGRLHNASAALSKATRAAPQPKQGVTTMAASPPSTLDAQIAALTSEVTNDNTVMESATTLINGIAAQIAAAVAAAQATGATPEELASLNALEQSLNTNAANLANAVQANTPAAPTPQPTPQPGA